MVLELSRHGKEEVLKEAGQLSEGEQPSGGEQGILQARSVLPEPDKHPAAMPTPCRKSLFDSTLGSGKAKKVVTFIEEMVNSSGSSRFPKTPPHSEDVLQSLYYYLGATMEGNISDQNFSHPAHKPLNVGGWNI